MHLPARLAAVSAAALIAVPLLGALPAGARPVPPGPGGYGSPESVRQISIDDVTVHEGDAGTTAATFTVSLDGPATIDGSVNVAFVAGSATPGVDAAPFATTTVVFLVGDQHETVTVDVLGDTAHESDETFFLVLQDDSYGYSIDDGTGLGTILDDDPLGFTTRRPASVAALRTR